MTDRIDQDNRTNALGLFNTARSYWRSGDYLSAAEVKVTHPQAPVTFLYCHAIELYLKAFLRGNGKSVADLKKIGHRVAVLAKQAIDSGLSLAPEHEEILFHIDDADVPLEARYIVTGFKSRPTNDGLSDISKSLDRTVGHALAETGLPIRGEDSEPTVPWRQNDLEYDTKRVLVHMFRAADLEDRDVGTMAMRLGLEKGVMEYHLDRLLEAGLADISGSHPDLGHIYWYVMPEGRRYVVERKLI